MALAPLHHSASGPGPNEAAQPALSLLEDLGPLQTSHSSSESQASHSSSESMLAPDQFDPWAALELQQQMQEDTGGVSLGQQQQDQALLPEVDALLGLRRALLM